MLIEIKSWITGEIMHSLESDSLKSALEFLVKQGAYLGGANLRGANLGGANLGGANLGGANLGDANLGGANLGGAYLRGAYLGGAYLRGANLGGANLGDANLGDANLGGANLRGANLRGANLGGAYLGGANLGDANLGGANLGGANLGGAKIGDLSCLTELADAIDLAPTIWREWENSGLEKAKNRFGLYKVPGEGRALIAMCPRLQGGYAFILPRREIWWWSWACPDPETVPVLWREADHQAK